MKIEKRDGSRERKILIGMITDATVLGRIAAKWDGHLFASKWTNLVANWCVDYFKKYDQPPKKAIEGIFETWADAAQDKDTTELVNKFLGGLSHEYEKNGEAPAPEHILDLAGSYFNRVKLSKLKESIETNLDLGRLDHADTAVAAYTKIEMGAGAGVDLFLDAEAVRSYFSESQKPLIEYPGALGRFFGNSLKRNHFISLMAPEKGSKSFWLMDIAYRAMCQRRKVAFFEVGDMTEDEIGVRLLTRAAKHPHDSPDGRWPCVIRYPTSIAAPADADSIAKIEFDTREFETPLGPKVAWAACERLMKSRVKANDSYFRLSVHANDSINVEGIKSVLDSWELGGFVPDVVICDYADILAPPTGTAAKEPRDIINKTWKQLRALSQERHCLLVTATQADAKSYDVKTMSRRHFSEDKRKLAHVSGCIGINMTSEEKDQGVARLNWVVRRKGHFSGPRCVHVATCLALGNPSVLSTF